MRVQMSFLIFWVGVIFYSQYIAGAAGVKEPSQAQPETVKFDTGGLSRGRFPKGFVFGTAASAYQVEGMAHGDDRGPSIWDVFVKIPGITPYANLNHYDFPEELEKRYNGWLSYQVVRDFADYADFCFKTFGDRVKNWMTFNEPRVVASLGYDNGFFAPGRCSKAYGNCTVGNSGTEPYIVGHHLILAHAAAVQRYRKEYQVRSIIVGLMLDGVATNHVVEV